MLPRSNSSRLCSSNYRTQWRSGFSASVSLQLLTTQAELLVGTAMQIEEQHRQSIALRLVKYGQEISPAHQDETLGGMGRPPRLECAEKTRGPGERRQPAPACVRSPDETHRWPGTRPPARYRRDSHRVWVRRGMAEENLGDVHGESCLANNV